MDNERYNDLNELHNLANITFQNVTNLTPALRQLVVNAKAYQKSVHATCNLAVIFIDSLQNIAKAALVSEGATKKIGDVLLDIIDTFKEIENMKLELTKLFINEVIIPLESRAEVQIGNMKLTHKSYNSENKLQTELYDKAQHSLAKVQKKVDHKKKRSPKLEAKVKEHSRNLDVEEAKLKKTREEGLRKALIEERRVYCFVAERMCAYGRGTVVYNNRISNFVNQKIPDWSQYIAKPTELPAESEDIIANPTGYKMGTVKRKVSKMDRKEALRRGKSFTNHYPTKYSTLDTRNSSRAGSRPSLSGISGSIYSRSNLSDGTSTPSSESPSTEKPSPFHKSPSSPQINYKYPASPNSLRRTSPYSHSPKMTNKSFGHLPKSKSVSNGNAETTAHMNGSSQVDGMTNENIPLQRFLSSRDELSTREEAIVATIVASNKAIKASEHNAVAEVKKSHSPQARSHSFSVQGKKESFDQSFSFNRTGSSARASKKTKATPEKTTNENPDFATRLSLIQTELHRQFSQSTETKSRVCHKALYDHVAQDASQLSFQKEDVIIPTCEPTSGWQYGEHEKTKKSGWFPASYTKEVTISDDSETSTLDDENSIKAESTSTIDSKTGDAKKPPPVAKKSFKGSVKKSGSGGTLPGKKKLVKAGTIVQENDPAGDKQVKSQLTSSSSMPMMIHMLHQDETPPPPYSPSPLAPKKEELSRASVVMNQDSFDTTDEETANQAKGEQKDYQSDSSDSLPPPPPPPPISDDEDSDETKIDKDEKKENAMDEHHVKQK